MLFIIFCENSAVRHGLRAPDDDDAAGADAHRGRSAQAEDRLQHREHSGRGRRRGRGRCAPTRRGLQAGAPQAERFAGGALFTGT